MHFCTTALYSGGRVLSKCMGVESAAQWCCDPGVGCWHLQADYVPVTKAWGFRGRKTCLPLGSVAEAEAVSQQQGRASASLQPNSNFPNQRQPKCQPGPSVSDLYSVLSWYGRWNASLSAGIEALKEPYTARGGELARSNPGT